MSNAMIANWWEHRLKARNPLGPSSVVGWDYRPRGGTTDTWPNAVARMSLYGDYQEWCEEQEIINIEEQLLFFLIMKPWLYIGPGGKDWHVRNYFVRQQEPFEGRWITLKKRRYFVRLLPWEDHAAAFQEATSRAVLKERSLPYDPT